MNINKLINKDVEDLVYKMETIELESLGISVYKYLPIERKMGFVNILTSILYDEEDGIFDEINLKVFMPVFMLEMYSPDLDFPEDKEDIDITGIYDMLMVSGAMNELKSCLYSEILEIQSLLKDKIKVLYRDYDKRNTVSETLKKLFDDMSQKTPEEVDALISRVNEMAENQNIQKMLDFKDRADV